MEGNKRKKKKDERKRGMKEKRKWKLNVFTVKLWTKMAKILYFRVEMRSFSIFEDFLFVFLQFTFEWVKPSYASSEGNRVTFDDEACRSVCK
jgi:hypothetical protein